MPGRIGRELDHYSGVDARHISAHFSSGSEPHFRYTLRLPFCGGEGRPKRVAVILKNPSAANVCRADTTIRRVEAYVHRHFPDASELVILNLYAYRATNTVDVRSRVADGGEIVGPSNDHHIRRWCRSATDIILAWGGNSSIPRAAYDARVNAVCGMLRRHRNKLWMVPKRDGSAPAQPLHGLRWSYSSCPRRLSRSP